MDLLTVEDAAGLTGMSASWWRQRIYRREVEYLKIGRSVKIPRSAVDDLLEKSLVKPRRKNDKGGNAYE